ncbi:Type I secretion system ATP-binding protein PrsD [Rickettsiales bacterium Ac37b]|nr:Type I secretion system ATP-binding protein PrsD [Rickettsiales bacterium Ac37b]
MVKSQINFHNPLKVALQHCRKAFIITFIFAFAVNVLMLLTSVYSLQVLDRVISSRNLETLLMLSLIVVAAYVALTLLQITRSFVLIKISEWLDTLLTPILFSHSISLSVLRSSVGANQALRDLDTVKNFLTSAGINTLFDAPWAIVYLAVIFILHPYLGYLTLIGGILLLGFAILNAYATSNKLNEANEHYMKSMYQSDIATRNAEVIEAMGMLPAINNNWVKFNNKKLEAQSVASYRNGIISNISKFLRMLLQMLVTAIGAYLVLMVPPIGFTTGGMIAASILVGRALAPIDTAIETWKQITGARKAYQRLNATLDRPSLRPEAMALPAPIGRLIVENAFFAPPSNTPQANKYTLKGVNFAIDAGDILAVIGPSAAGKSSLAKLIVGVWKPISGTVRLDDADVYSWKRDDFGKHVGYLPQDVELFNGTIKDNIARMQADVDPAKVVEAAQIAGAHEMILHLPNGYDTDIGMGGSSLSGGQRQRIGLARAFFGDPKLVVLDEPNANLDEIGEQALMRALSSARTKKITTIVISHRPSVLANVDKILILQEGSIVAFGPRDEVLARFAKTPSANNTPHLQKSNPS